MSTLPAHMPEPSPVESWFIQLVQQSYTPLHRLAWARLGSPVTAGQAVLDVLKVAWEQAARRHIQSGDLWLYELAVHRIPRRRLPRETAGATAAAFWNAIHALDNDEHLLLVLTYGLNWLPAESARLLHVGQGAVQAQIQLFRARLAPLIPQAAGESPDAAIQRALSERYPSPPASTSELETLARQIIQGAAAPAIPGVPEAAPRPAVPPPVQPPPMAPVPAEGEIPPEGIPPTVEAAPTAVAEEIPAPERITPTVPPTVPPTLRLPPQPEAGAPAEAAIPPVYEVPAGPPPVWLLVLGSVLLVAGAMAIAGLGWWLVQGQAGGLLQPTASPIGNLPTPITPAPRLADLSRNATTEQIITRWQDSPGLWRTLTIDAQITDYGPPGYSGPPRQYRSQAWISQPGESVEVFGLLAAPPTRILFTAAGRQFERDLLTRQTDTRDWDGYAIHMLGTERLRWMVYPVSSPWAAVGGSFVPVQTVQYLKRKTILFDRLTANGQVQARMWLDAATGMILRIQEYGGPEYAWLLADSIVTSFALDQAAPPNQLTDAARSLDLPAPEQGFEPIQPTLTPAITLSPHPPIAEELPPTGFDPAGSRLVFELDREALRAGSSSPAASRTGATTPQEAVNDIRQPPTLPFRLYADGYLLGRLPFGLPWGLRCTRSPDGYWLAFNNATDGAAPGNERLRWVDIRRPDRVIGSGDGLEASAFTFSPDSHRLAVFGRLAGQTQPAVYQIDLLTGTRTLLMDMDTVIGLVYSQDQMFLAFTGNLPGEADPSLVVVHLPTGQTQYLSESGVTLDQAYPQSPLILWGIPLPTPTGDLQDCSH